MSGMLAKCAQGILQRHSAAAVRCLAPPLCRFQHAVESEAADVEEFRELVHDFASRGVAPHAADIDRNNAFPRDVNLWTAMGHMGLHGVPLA